MAEISKMYLESDILPDQFPGSVAQALYEQSAERPENRFTIHAFRNLMRFDNNDGIVTYVGEFPKADSSGRDFGFEGSFAKLIDINVNKLHIGEGSIIHGYDIGNPASDGKPYVAWTGTAEGFRKQGLGLRRLKVMNVVAQELYGKPLNSDSEFFIEEEARSLWRHLVQQELADRYSETYGGLRYRFKT